MIINQKKKCCAHLLYTVCSQNQAHASLQSSDMKQVVAWKTLMLISLFPTRWRLKEQQILPLCTVFCLWRCSSTFSAAGGIVMDITLLSFACCWFFFLIIIITLYYKLTWFASAPPVWSWCHSGFHWAVETHRGRVDYKLISVHFNLIS